MGIHDRDYYRPEGPPPALSMTSTLVLINVGAFLLNWLIGNQFFGHSLFEWLWCKLPDDVRQPWRLYTLVTYGFAHDPEQLKHIVFNMIGLWCFGREIEQIYGRMEFLRLYLAAVLAGGLEFLIQWAITGCAGGILLGASAGVLAVVMLFVLHYPKRTILLMAVIPLPAWVIGVLFVVMDISGAMDGTDHTAHGAHLAGAAFAFAYYRSGVNFGRWLPRDWRPWKRWSRPNLRVHDPEASAAVDEAELQHRVDEILAKITASGEGSLTRKERQILEQASRRYQRRRD